MLKGRIRICEVCGDEIPKGTKYRVSNMRPEGAAMLLELSDTDLIPTWTQNPDGKVRLDICLDCSISMGHPPDIKKDI